MAGLTKDEMDAILKQSKPFEERTPPVTPSAPEGSVSLEPSPNQYTGATLLGATEGFGKGMGFTAGAATGLRLGMAASPYAGAALGPVGAAAAPVVGLVGGVGASMLFNEGLDKLAFDDLRERIKQVDAKLLPYYEGGVTFGQSIGAAPAAFFIPQMTGNRVSRFISEIGASARRAPVRFMGAQVLPATTAGIAGGTVYSIDPEARGTRAVAEIGAGLFTPTRLVSSAVTSVYDFLAPKMTQTGREGLAETAAARQLQNILAEHGEDIPALIRKLERPLPGGVPTPTAAQKTRSGVLGEIERALSNMHPKFGADTEAQGKQALRAYTLLVERLSDIGSPDALVRAAQLRDTLFKQMIDGRLATADENAARKIVRIKQDNAASRAQIGDIVKSETSLALQNARMVESQLWEEAIRRMTEPVVKQERIPPDTRLSLTARFMIEGRGLRPGQTITRGEAPTTTPSRTFQTFLNLMENKSPVSFEGIVGSPEVVNIMESLGASKAAVMMWRNTKLQPEYLEEGKRVLPGSYKPKEVEVQDLVSHRNRLLDLARAAEASGNRAQANLYGSLAESMLDDLSALKNPMFDAARDFSRALNDTFTRTFADKATYQGSKVRSGAERLPAEVLVNRAFGSNADVTAQRMLEIEDAAGFLRTQYDDALKRFGPRNPITQTLKPLARMSDESVVSIQDAQKRILQLMAARSLDPITGRVNPKSLQTFVNENQTMLTKVGLADDLSDIVKAEMALRNIANQNSYINRTLYNQTAFARVLAGGENPTNAILDAIHSRSPVQSMRQLVQFAKSGGEPALNGLKSSIFDYAFTKAGGAGNFDPEAFKAALFAPLAPNKPSLSALMRDNGMLSYGELRNINELIRPMMKIKAAMSNKQAMDEVIGQAGPVTDLALRVIGAKVGADVAGQQGPGTLVAAGAGSKAMRQIFDKMPAGMMRATMEEAMRDPKLLSLLLQKPVGARGDWELARTITARLIGSGVVPASMMNYIDRPPAEAQPQQGTPSQRQMQRQSSAPPTRGVPNVTPVAPPATPGAGAGAASGPVSAAPGQADMYQALFPQDRISSLMAMQQPSG